MDSSAQHTAPISAEYLALARRCAELERRLDETEAMLQDTAHGVALFDSCGRFVKSNRAFIAFSGIPAEMFTPGVTRLELRDYVNAHAVLGPMEELAELAGLRSRQATLEALDSKLGRSTYFRRHPDGRMLEIVDTQRPDGSFVVTMADVTELLTVQHEATERAEILDAVMNNARFGISVFDSQHRIRARNQMARHFAPYPDLPFKVGTPYAEILAEIGVRAARDQNLQVIKWVHTAQSVDRSKPMYYSRPGFGGGWVDIYSDPTADGGFIITHMDVTALKAARDAEMRLAEIHRKMLDTMSQGIIIYDKNFELLACNKLAAEMTCNALEDFIPGTHRLALIEMTTKNGGFGVGTAGKMASEEAIQIDRASPQTSQRVNALGRTILVQSVPEQDGGFVITFTDVTQLAQTEKAERERAELLHTTLDSIHHGFKVFGPDQRLRMINPRALLQAPDIKPGSPMPTYREMVTYSLQHGVFGVGEPAAAIAQSLLRLSPHQAHRKILSLPTGRKFEFFVTPTSDSGFVVANIDVTDIVNARLASEAAALELQALIAAMPGALIRQRKNPDGSWQRFFISDRLSSLTGHTNLEASDPKWIIQNADPADYPAVLDGVEQAYAGGQSVAEFRFRRKNGQWIWIRAMMRGNIDSSGMPEAICIWSDITRERELKTQIAHSRRLAQMGEVATGMAHEMNQPLASISIAAENALRALERQANPTAHVREKLLVIANQAHRAAAMIDRVQEYSRYGHAPSTPVRLQAVLANALEQVELTLKHHHVRLVGSIGDDVPAVLAREGLLERALSNLITNACEAYQRRPDISISNRVITIETRNDGPTLHLLVRDQAGGIDENILPRVFEPFFTTKPVGQGTGLGLSVAFGIVTDIGGSISVRNVDGGAEFDVTLFKATSPQ